MKYLFPRTRVMIASAIVCVSTTAAAVDLQEDGTEVADPADTQASPAKPGYHSADFRVRPSVSITQKYDSNIFATDSGEESDWITILSPRLKIDSTWPEHRLSLQMGADAGRYWENDAENYQDYWISADGRYVLNETTELFGGAGISLEHEGRDSPDAALGGFEPTLYQTRNAHAGVRHTLGNYTLRLGGTFEGLDFDNVQTGAGTLVNDDRDRNLYGIGARLTRKLDARNEVFGQVLFDLRDYDQAADQNGFDRDSEGYRAAIGAKHVFGPGSSAEAYVGVLHQSYQDGAFDDVTTLDFGAKATFLPQPATRITGQVTRALNETTDAGSPGYLHTSFSGAIEHRVSPRLIPHVKARYSIADYQQTGREDTTWSAEAGVKYFLARNAYVVAGVRHVERDSNDAGLVATTNDYAGDTIFLTFATQGYPLQEPAISGYSSTGEAAVGLLLLAEDAERFGRYSGLTDNGVYLDGNLVFESSDGKQGWALIDIRDLGLDSRSAALDWGSRGVYEAYVHYDETPFHDFTGQTVFNGVGGANLTLPAGWVTADSTADMTALNASLQPVSIGTQRKKLGAGTQLFSPDQRWSASVSFDTETKDGLAQLAAAIGTAPGNVGTALLPVPVDYTTNSIDAALAYAGDRSVFNVAYHGNFFYNNLNSVSWENPFRDTGPLGTQGAVSTAPDNQFHQLSLSGAHAITPTIRLTGSGSVGVMLQDDTFQPDTVNPTLTPNTLPRDSLDGKVFVYNGLLALSARCAA